MDRTKKSFMVATITILVLMVFTYVLTLTLQCEGISFIKWLFSPILVLGSSSGVTTISIIVFLLIIGGISNSLNKCGFIDYMLNYICHRHGRHRYRLVLLVVFFFMMLGSCVGSFEEVVPMVPILVALANRLGFDDLTGISISLLAVGCGFAAGVFNPFTIGVAQTIAGLPMFSGASLRILSFVLIYLLLIGFIFLHIRKIEKREAVEEVEFVEDENKKKAFIAFGIVLGIGIALVLCSTFLTFLQDYTMVIIAVMFLVAGILATALCKTPVKDFLVYFRDGALEIAPSIILILMASSIKYTMEESGVLNTIIDGFAWVASHFNRVALILFIYLICLVMEIFIPSGSAKAFLIIPIIVPLASRFGISAQLCILAFAFGDGFSNVFYPTNPALLISLGLVNMEYEKWFRYSWKFQAINFILTSGILLLGLLIGY